MDVSRLATLDGAMLLLLLLSVLIGLWRGLVFELLSLAGWLVAWFVAQRWGAGWAAWLPGGADAPGRPLAGMALCFLATLVAWALLARLLRALVSATPLRWIDRVLGAGFGLLRGGVILLVAATLVALTPLAREPAWQGSQGAAWLDQALQMLRPWWPDSPRPAERA